MINQTIVDLISNTQLIKLQHLIKKGSADIYLKIESDNASDSLEDRIGLAMIIAAEKSGELKAGGTIVEATSGNTGIALAMVAAARGYRCILTIPETMSLERRLLLSLHGVELVLTASDDGMTGVINKALEIADIEGAFMLKQFVNPVNPEIHRETTAEEIWLTTKGKIDAFVCGVGTGGTISGIAEGIKTKNPKLQVIAVQATESTVISGGKYNSHKIQGIGMGFIPKNRNTHLLDSIEQVSAHEASAVCHSLATKEAILAGISSGASICAALRVAEKLGSGKVVVTVVRDTGKRYLSMEG